MHCYDHAKHKQGNCKAALKQIAAQICRCTGKHAAKLVEDRHGQRSKSDSQHNAHGNPEHPALAIRTLEEYSTGNQGQCAQQLICGAEQRPYICISGFCQSVGHTQCYHSSCILVRKEFEHRSHIFLIYTGIQEKLLEGKAADTRNRVQRGQSKCRHGKVNECEGYILGDADLAKERGNRRSEYNGRCTAGNLRAAGYRANSNQRNHSQKAFQQHGSKGNRQHMLFVLYLFGGRTGGHQRMEAADCAAGNGHKQDGKHMLAIDGKAIECIQIHLRICNEHTHYGCHDHNHKKIAVQIVARLQQRPYRNNRCYSNIQKHDYVPGSSGYIHRKRHAQNNIDHQQANGNGRIDKRVEPAVFKHAAKSDCRKDKQH